MYYRNVKVAISVQTKQTGKDICRQSEKDRRNIQILKQHSKGRSKQELADNTKLLIIILYWF